MRFRMLDVSLVLKIGGFEDLEDWGCKTLWGSFNG